ncbi:MAG: sigma-70 family RNA polymerase sigma factor, partial [Candidatus Binataceae bacterium]
MQAVAQRNEFSLAAIQFGPLARMNGLRHGPMQRDVKEAKSSAELAPLLEAIAARQDREAFAALFDHFAPRIKAFLMRSNTTAAGAEELAQEALLTVWRKAAQFDRSRAGAAAWIFTIARNLRIDVARRERLGSLLDVEANENVEQPAAPDELLLASEREQRVREALVHLSDDQIRVVRL